MKVRDIIRRLEQEGWRPVVTKGSHRQFKHPTNPGRVTVAGHRNDDLPPGTLNSIQKQAGWKGESK
ncbi:MAG TPA: type II toxin-antitoxin system HicA family toxin [Terriglobia bacterium]|nr:type II toxin-antitoxin system HicA family toxin [Terriglobia bacterium]